MRVLFTTQPGSGHFHPLVPLARALAAAGHDVAFASAASLGPTIIASGFHAFPAGLDWFAGDPARPRPMLPRVPGEPLGVHWITILADPMIADLERLCADWRPDLLVRDTSEYGACVVAERLGLPHASVAIGGWVSDYGRRPAFGPYLDALRARHGRQPDPEVAMPFRYLNLAFMPPRFHDATHSRGPTTHFARPEFFDRSGDEDLPGWVDALPAQPTIYATLGTVAGGRSDIFAAVLAGLRDEPLNLILTVGRHGDAARFGPQPAHIRIARYIPQSLLLPRCAATVCQGGFSTVLGALAHGVPAVVFPLGTDHPVHAARVAALGAGRVIEPADLTPTAVRAAVRAVLADASYRANAGRVRDEIAALPGLEHAVALLERLAAERRPILAG